MPDSLPIHEWRAWLRLSLEPGLAPRQARALLARFGLPHAVYSASLTALCSLLARPLAQQLLAPASRALARQVERSLDWLASPGHHLLCLGDARYPPALLHTPDPPLLLYAIGQPALLHRAGLAIVGARAATPGGMASAHRLAGQMAAQGWAIVSGLAEGIDGAAHRGALAAGGATIAVLGTGINRCYPAQHAALAAQIARHGLLLSEFALGSPARPHHFPRRNRLVAGLSRGVLVVEAGERSGSLITARLAGELGRDVFAVPGSIHSSLSRGCHALIRDGARLVENTGDILEELQAGGQALPQACPDTAGEACDGPAAAVLRALGHDVLHPDELIARSGLAAGELAATLVLLEQARQVHHLHDGRYQRR